LGRNTILTDLPGVAVTTPPLEGAWVAAGACVAGAAVAGGGVGAAVVAAGPQAARRSIAMIDRLNTVLLSIFFLLEIG
jgi:hypothetical protein